MRLGLGAAMVAVVAASATGASGSSSGGTITTIAGTGTKGFSGDGGLATSAQLSYPAGVAVDGKRNVYIADRFNLRVRKISAGGRITTIAGNGRYGSSGDGGPATSARLYYPVWVAADRVGNVYITDGRDEDLNTRVRKVSPNGTITAFAGTVSSIGGFSGDGGPATSAQLNSPRGLAVDAQGNVYIADAGNNRVRKVSLGGTITTIAGTGKRGFSGDGGPATSAQLSVPVEVAVDRKGNVYIVDAYNLRVRKVSRGGTITTIAGTGKRGSSGDGGPATSARLNWPEGLAVDRQGNVYITDADTSRVRKVGVDGRITTIAGTGKQGFSGDSGPAASAQLYRPRGLAVDGQGNVYISDAYNQRVRKVRIGPAPAISSRCSKAAAVQVATRLRVGVDPFLGRTPIFQVLCGPFLGPGSQAMVASVAVPTGCGGSVGWAVFRFAGGTWQLVMERRNGAFLSAAGSDIRERVGAPRAGDPRCSPSVWKTRIWHWNGKRFTVSAWKVTGSRPPPKPKAPAAAFISPSRNLSCEMTSNSVYCQSIELPHSVKMKLDGSLTRCRGTRCLGNPAENTPVLAYGKRITVGRFSCMSAQSGVTCTVMPYGKGFLIDRNGVKRVGS